MGSDCENKRLAGLNHGRMTTEEGLEIRNSELPCVLVAEGFEHPEAFDRALERVNSTFLPTIAVTGEIDADLFSELDLGPVENRYGAVLVWEGFVGTPDWDEGLDFNDDGGIADLVWDEATGEIVYADIVVNSDIAYDADTVELVLVHEIGHACFGLAHDEDSMDLGSCMSNPPPYDCHIISADVELVLD